MRALKLVSHSSKMKVGRKRLVSFPHFDRWFCVSETASVCLFIHNYPAFSNESHHHQQKEKVYFTNNMHEQNIVCGRHPKSKKFLMPPPSHSLCYVILHIDMIIGPDTCHLGGCNNLPSSPRETIAIMLNDVSVTSKLLGMRIHKVVRDERRGHWGPLHP